MIELGARLSRNLQEIQTRIARAAERSARQADAVTLVAVTKAVPVEVISQLHELGHRHFGENRPQALWDRATRLPAGARWHMIGHLQTNKVRKTVPLVELVHSVDSVPLATAIAEESRRTDRTTAVLAEVNVSGEASKHGFSPDDFRARLAALNELSGISVRGLMTMAPLDADEATCRDVFRELRLLREELDPAGTALPLLSMGMSQDFEIAIEEGATHVRIGTALFEGIE